MAIRKLSKSTDYTIPVAIRNLLLILMVVNRDLLISTSVIRPEGLAYGLCLYLIVTILFTTEPDRWFGYRLVLIMALLISQRMIFLAFTPFVLGSLVFRTQPVFSWKATGKLLLAFGLALCLTNPFLITDTLIQVKAFAGGVMLKVAAETPGQSSIINNDLLQQCLQPVNTCLILLTLLGLYAFQKQYTDKRVAWLYIANLVLFGMMIARSSVVYSTHLLPLRALGLVPLAYGGIAFWQLITRRKQFAVQVMGSLYCMVVLYESLQFQIETHQPTNYHQVVSWLNSLAPDTKVLLSPDFEAILKKNSASLTRELAAIQDPELSQAKLNRVTGFLNNKPDQLNGSTLFNEILLEDERLASLQHRLLLHYTPAHTFIDPYFYGTQAGFVNYYIPKDEALKNFDQGAYSFLILEYPLENRQPERVFNQLGGLHYFVYTPEPQTATPNP